MSRDPSPRRPLVSVLIGNYNHAPYLGDCIESVLAQTHRPIEIVVVDDGSTDDSREVLAGYADRVVTCFQENRGQAAALSTAAAHATGDVLATLDADDGWYPNKLDRVLAALDANPRAEWVRHKLVLVDRERRSLGAAMPSFRGSGMVPPDPLLQLEGVLAAGTTIVLRRRLADRVFPLPAHDPLLFGDAVLLAKVLGEGAWGYSLDEPLGFYRRHATESTSRGGLAARLAKEAARSDALSRLTGSTHRPTVSFKLGAIAGALRGAPWWDRSRLGNLLGGLGAATHLLHRPPLFVRQTAGLALAFVAPGVWVREHGRRFPSSEPPT